MSQSNAPVSYFMFENAEASGQNSSSLPEESRRYQLSAALLFREPHHSVRTSSPGVCAAVAQDGDISGSRKMTCTSMSASADRRPHQ